MDVLHSHIVKVSARQTGIVEAHVHLIIRVSPTCEPSGQSVIVTVQEGPPNLKQRIHQEAALMAEKLTRFEHLYRQAVSPNLSDGEAED